MCIWYIIQSLGKGHQVKSKSRVWLHHLAIQYLFAGSNHCYEFLGFPTRGVLCIETYVYVWIFYEYVFYSIPYLGFLAQQYIS